MSVELFLDARCVLGSLGRGGLRGTRAAGAQSNRLLKRAQGSPSRGLTRVRESVPRAGVSSFGPPLVQPGPIRRLHMVLEPAEIVVPPLRLGAARPPAACGHKAAQTVCHANRPGGLVLRAGRAVSRSATPAASRSSSRIALPQNTSSESWRECRACNPRAVSHAGQQPCYRRRTLRADPCRSTCSGT